MEEHDPGLRELLENTARSLGATQIGVADLQPVRAYILREYGEFFARWPRAVAVALYFPREIAGQLLHGPTLEYNYYYHVLNRQLDAIAVALTNCLAVAGYS
ncbi:MAG: hypothetical protein PHD67_09995, partial [Oscillospiraceae bacterium]|nr:hypothetical protein [Oscillospiraceae bacterium]